MQLFGQFCGALTPALPLGAACFVMDALQESFGNKFPLVNFTVRVGASRVSHT